MQQIEFSDQVRNWNWLQDVTALGEIQLDSHVEFSGVPAIIAYDTLKLFFCQHCLGIQLILKHGNDHVNYCKMKAGKMQFHF